ncbi:MAG: hypothetical protein WEB50_04380 [Vicinamibacterales bacterium]
MTATNPDSVIRTPVLLAALMVLALLAAAPFAAVRTLHGRRLAAADAALEALAAHLRGATLLSPSGPAILTGPGALPRANDAAWLTATSAPLTAVAPPVDEDPWANAYVVNTGVGAGQAIWILSAGPNGIIETPFEQPSQSAVLAGDDRGVRLR